MKSQRAVSNLLLGILLIFAFQAIVRAQSGRRSPQPISPTPKPAPTPEPEKPASSKPDLPKQNLIVAMDDLGRSITIPRYMAEDVWNGFTERLRSVSYLVLTVGKEMGNKEASDRAKKETETFVVLLRMETVNMDSGSVLGQSSPDNVVVNYAIFAPQTGKVKERGRVFARANRGILGGTIPTASGVSSQLRDTGRETANRVLDALQLGNPTIMH